MLNYPGLVTGRLAAKKTPILGCNNGRTAAITYSSAERPRVNYCVMTQRQ